MALLGIICFYGVITILLLISLRNKTKTKESLLEAWHSFKHMAPLIIIIMLIVALLDGVLGARQLGTQIVGLDGFVGLFSAAVLGAIIHVPPFAAFPIAGQLMNSGVNPGVVATLINTLIMVHVVSIPIEIKTLGFKFAIARNLISFVGAIIIGAIIGVIL